MRRERIQRTFLSVVVMLVLVLCVVVPTEAATKAKLSSTKAELVVGETLQLKLTGGTGTITWSTSKKSIATVSKNGLVTAKKVGSCVITAKQAGKKYSCKITVTKLPDDYATVNGKKVKVGSTVKITYTMQSSQPIAMISIKYKYNRSALKIVNAEENSRYKTWVNNEYIPEYHDDDNSVYDIAHLVGVDKKDPYNFANISCKTAKVMEVMKVKVLKSGNYKMNTNIYSVSKANGDTVKSYKVTETVK